MDLEWEPPEKDGGIPILKYVIEIRESRRSTWGRAGITDGMTTQFTPRNLVVDNEYFFRIRAVNEEGEGPPLESVEGVVPVIKIGVFSREM